MMELLRLLEFGGATWMTPGDKEDIDQEVLQCVACDKIQREGPSKLKYS
jgi:hypothetical protein